MRHVVILSSYNRPKMVANAIERKGVAGAYKRE